MENIACKKWPFLFIRQGELDVLKLFGITVYKRLGVIHWCLGYVWIKE